MKTDHPGDHRVPGEVHGTRAGRHGDRPHPAYRLDFSIRHHHHLIFGRRSAGSIDHADMRQGNDRLGHCQELP
jgi:hypothetical protein